MDYEIRQGGQVVNLLCQAERCDLDHGEFEREMLARPGTWGGGTWQAHLWHRKVHHDVTPPFPAWVTG